MFFSDKRRSKAKVYAYDDVKGRGRLLVASARKMGMGSDLFSDPSIVPDSPEVAAYLHMVELPGELEKSTSVARALARKPSITMIPRSHECDLFHSKIRQTEKYSDWMPPTKIIYSRPDAEAAFRSVQFPFISKSDHGGQSRNVRLVADRAAAMKEIDQTFGGGMPLSDGTVQSGYLYWQEFMPGNDFDWRIAVIAKRYAYLGRRFNREGTPFASGNDSYDVPRGLDDEVVEKLDYALDFAVRNDRVLVGMDVVRGKDGRPVMLEAHAAWGWKRAGAPFYEHDGGRWRRSGFNTSQLYDVIAKAIMDGDFRS